MSAAWLAFGGASASAAIIHSFLSSIDGTPAGSFSFGFLSGVAVDNSSTSSAGSVYVSDTLHSVVDAFSASGSYLCQITGAGDASKSTSECDTVNQVTGDAGVPQGSLNTAYGQGAVDSAGDLWYPDALNHVVDEFSSTGEYVPNSQITVPNNGVPVAVALDSSGDVFVAVFSGAVDEYKPSTGWTTFASGTPAGSFGGVSGVAVDNDPSSPAFGDVYVADQSHKVVDVFNSSGVYQPQLQLTGTPSGAGNTGGPFVGLERVAVDPASGDVYVADQGNGTVDEFDPTGTYLDQITLPSNGKPYAVALAAGSGDVYVIDQPNNRVDLFGPGEIVPNVTTGQASNLSRASATLNGEVDPAGGGDVTSCEFEYVDAADYNPSAADPYSAGKTVSCSPSTFASATNVTASISGLSPDTIYHFRVEGTNAHGTDVGSDQTFAVSPVIDSEASTGAATTTVNLSAQINPLGLDTSCQVQYVTDAAFQRSGYADPTTTDCTPHDLGSGVGDQAATASLTGLTLDTTYHYRFLATNQAGTATGPDQTLATFGIKSMSMQTVDQNLNPYTQAGGHPYELITDIEFNTTHMPCPVNGCPELSPAANFRDLYTDLPAGLIGNPIATPTCTEADLVAQQCSGAAQVGTVDLTGTPTSCGPTSCSTFTSPLYNVVPPPGEPARLGFYVTGNVVGHIDTSVRTGGDYGITAAGLEIDPDAGITEIKVTLWGVPGDPSHDAERVCRGPLGSSPSPPCSSNSPLVPFVTDPTSCSGPITLTARADAWQDPGDFASATSTMPGFTGCNNLDFTPSITVQPDTTTADSSSGLSVDLHMSQDGLLDPNDLAEANLKDATVTLPQGVSVNPSAANGLTACTPAEIGIDNADEPTCPDSSKIGSVEVDTPLLANPLTGGVYVAEPNDNPFNSLLAIYVTAEDPVSGVLVKLAGHVVANPVTGQLETTFSNNPQLPFTDFKLDFFGGPQAALATPESCGTFSSTSDLSSWSGGPDVTSSDSFPVNSGCVSGFSPSFSAGTQNAQAGAYSPFVLTFSRSDTDQNFQGLTVKLPPGMLAKLKGVAECSDADLATAAAKTGVQEQADPSCPASSQVGTVTTTAGAGPDPMPITGNAYLTGPYKGGPYGIAVVVPAVAGPYDLGTVVVRQALEINPTTAQVTDVSDPFPSILDGIPLRIRSVSVDLNRRDFTVNPTSCNPMSLTGALSSTGGLTYNADSHFQVGGCQDIGFSPKLKIALTGKGKTRSGDHPTLTATLTDRTGQANLRSAKVTLPLSMALDPNNSQHVCAYATAAAVHGGAVGCATKTIVGKAIADTPLLSKPLTGNVYLVQGLRCAKGSISAQGTCANGKTAIHTLPTLLVPLRGQIALDLRAKSSVNGAGALVTTFATIPDAPVSKFTLQIAGGPKGLLVVTGRGLNICAKKQVGDADFGAQSGKTMTGSMTLATPCAGVKHKTKQHTSKRTTKSRRAGLLVDRRLS